jgi:hypothetical protein
MQRPLTATLGFSTALIVFTTLGCRAVPATPLAQAAARGDTTLVGKLIAQGRDVDGTDAYGLTPLMWAARNGRVATIRALLKAGAGPDVRDRGPNGWTPLAHAIHRNQCGAVQALLDGGADPNRTFDEHRVTPLMMAAGYGYTDGVEALLARGADPRIATVGGFTALAAAVRGAPDIDRFTFGRCQLSTVKALVAAVPDLELPDNGFGRSARWAAWLGNCEQVLRVVDGQARRPHAARSSPAVAGPQGR